APLRRADAFALQIPRRVDASAGAHVNAGMTEDFGERDRHRHERALAAAFERRVGGKRKLGDLKFLVVQHALEGLTRTQNLDLEVDALRFHAPVDQRTGAVVVPAGEREFEIGHRATYGVGASCGWRKRMNGGRNKSGSALIAIGRKAKRGLAPRSHAAPLSTGTRRASLWQTAKSAADTGAGSAGALNSGGRASARVNPTAPTNPSTAAKATVHMLAVMTIPAKHSRISTPERTKGQARRANQPTVASRANDA